MVDPEGEGVQLIKALNLGESWLEIDGDKQTAIDEAMGALHNGCTVAIEINNIDCIDSFLLFAAKRRRALSKVHQSRLFFFCRKNVNFSASVQVHHSSH